jgi:hypothetical protein
MLHDVRPLRIEGPPNHAAVAGASRRQAVVGGSLHTKAKTPHLRSAPSSSPPSIQIPVGQVEVRSGALGGGGDR